MESISSYQIVTRPERTERIENLYQYIRSFKAGICVERAHLMTESYKRNIGLPTVVQRAQVIADVLDQMTLYLMPGSLFAGNQASLPRWAPLFPEFDVEWVEDEVINGKPYFPCDRPADRYDFLPENRQTLVDVINWWKGRTHTDRLRCRLSKDSQATHFDIKAADLGTYFQGGDGHYAPDHKLLFTTGLTRIIEECQDYRDAIDWTQPEAAMKKDFYDAAIISCKAVIRYAHRFADLAQQEADKEKDFTRKKELQELSDMCRRVPEHPARNFKEALQFVIFIHICVQIEDNGAGISFGRFDQFMWEMYEKGLKDGSLNHDTALEMVENFYLQIYSNNKVRSWTDTDYYRGVPMFQNLTIGGQDPKTKSDATNELSYICLEATANTRVPQPSLTVRFHKKSPLEFKMKVAEVVRLGMGLPSIFNDEVYIPALMNRGYQLDDAYNYCIIGCVEPGTAGLLGGRTGGAWLNCVKMLEMSLFGGRDPRTGLTLLPNKHGKDLSTFESFEEVREAYLEQLDFYIKQEAIMENTIDQLWEETLEEPMAAVFGCYETTVPRGKPIKRGGAKYDLTGQQTIGTANVANSLYSIKKLVFDEKKLTGAQLMHALETNFSDDTTNPTGRQVKAMCMGVPKYGNDVDEVDFLTRDMLAHVAQELPKYKNTRYGRGPIGCTLHCSTSTVSSNTPFGKVCGATPDGRDAYTSLADGQSPMRGTDKLGPTASISSVSKLNNILLSCGSLYNLKFVPEDLY